MKHSFHWDNLLSYRGLLIALAALLFAAALYPRPKRVALESGVTEIVYWTPREANDAMKLAIEEFQRRNPHSVLQGQATVRDATGDPTRFLLGVAGGVPPDLIFFDRFAIVEWASRGAFTDLTPFMESDRGRPDAILEENYVRPAWLEPIYQGRIYGIANSVDNRALYYNSDDLIRAGFVYRDGDPEVAAGQAEAGDARPPKTWEELCLKLFHAEGKVDSGGVTNLTGWTRRPAVNESRPKDEPMDLHKAGVREGDVAVLVADSEIFRARVGKILGPAQFRLDLRTELPPGLGAVPSLFSRGACEIKVFGQNSYMARLTRFDPETGVLRAAGFIPLYGNSWLYMFGWLNGAEFTNADGSECLLDSPEIVEALQFMVDMYDVLGGAKVANVFRVSADSAPVNPFLDGKISMLINGNWFLSYINAFKPNLNFGVVPSPQPAARLAAGSAPVSWLGGWAYAIPTPAKNKQAAWELLRWLCSVEANQLMAEYNASLQRAQGQVAFPSLHPDKRVMAWLDQQYLENSPTITDRLKKSFRVFVQLLPESRYRPVTPVGQFLWNEHVRATDAAINHTKRPYDALNFGKRQVQIALERALHPPAGPKVPWNRLIAGYVACVILAVAAMVVAQEKRRRLYGGRRGQWIDGYVCAMPWLSGFIIFGAGPILFSLIISFCHYDVLNPARFIGLTNYVNLLGSHYDAVVNQKVANDPTFWVSLVNTGFMVIGVPVGIAAGLALALLLDSKVRGLHVYRTVYYLPAIVPAVASFILWLWVFDPSRGLVNQALVVLGVDDPPIWLQDPSWAKPSLILMGLWGVGGSMIIWLAGLKDIPESLYEAASIDGASRWQRFRHITVPMLSPYIFFNLIMGLIGVFQIFEAAYVMTNGGPADATLFYAYKLFNEAFRYLNMGTASAMAWILLVVVLSITLLQLWLSKKWVHYERQ